MKIYDMEKRLRLHAEAVKNAIELSLDIEKEEMTMKKTKSKFNKVFAIAAAAILVCGTTAFAAYRYMSAYEFANRLGESTLADYFKETGTEYETVTDGKYKATFLGTVSGKKLKDIDTDNPEEYHTDRTYAVVAVEKTDGSDMSYDDNICITPLIQGYKPWQLNIAVMNGGYSQQIIDGVLYRMIECDNIEYFADRQIYMAAADMTFIDNRPFKYDDDTGLITENEEYEGTNILFELKFDKAKADKQRAEEYLKEIGFAAAD